jgi:toxin ParE1/3/4
MILQLCYNVSAEQDLFDHWRYLFERDPRAADNVVDVITTRIESLLLNPFLGPPRQDIADGLRYLVCGSYVVLYKVEIDCIRIVRIVHGSQDLPTLRNI